MVPLIYQTTDPFISLHDTEIFLHENAKAQSKTKQEDNYADAKMLQWGEERWQEIDSVTEQY